MKRQKLSRPPTSAIAQTCPRTQREGPGFSPEGHGLRNLRGTESRQSPYKPATLAALFRPPRPAVEAGELVRRSAAIEDPVGTID